MEDWLTTDLAAELGGYHPEHIRLLMRENKIMGRKWGLSWQVSKESLTEKQTLTYNIK